MLLKKIILPVFAIVFPCIIFCQPAQKGSLGYLSLCNGLKQIKLGSDLGRLDPGKLAYLDDVDSLDADGCYKFCYKDSDMLYLGNGLLLNRIGLRTYNGRIVNIYLFFPRDAGHSVLKSFEANYGEYTDILGEFMYDWKTTGVTLSLRYSRAVEMGVAIFTCVDVENQMVENGNRQKPFGRDANDPVAIKKFAGSPKK